MSPWTIYLITRCDYVSGALMAVWIVSVVVAVVAFCVGSTIATDTKAETLPPGCVRLLRWLLGVFLVSGVGFMLTPTTKQMAAIIAIPAIVNNEKVQSEASELYGLAKEWMRQQVGAQEEGEDE